MLRSPRLLGFSLAALVLAACGSAPPRSRAVLSTDDAEAPPAAVEAPARPWLEHEVHGDDLLAPETVAAFYAARHDELAWQRPGAIAEVMTAIEGISADGLDPDDYHRKAIADLIEDRARKPSAKRDAELDALVTDAVAAVVDHVRYGKVHPVDLDPQWNVDPRAHARPVVDVVAEIAAASSQLAAIDKAKPQHFIYRGLVDALAELRRVDAAGGWTKVPRGPSIRLNARDARLAAVRTRLGVTAAAARYDAPLLAAVKAFQAAHRLPATGVIDRATVDELNVAAADRADQVRVNLERARWVVGDLDDDFILVNLPAYKAYVIRDGKKVFETKTMIGKEARQSPTFRATLKTVVFNPDWFVPPTILAEDILPKMRAGNDVIGRKHLEVQTPEGLPVDPAAVDWRNADPEKFPYRVRQAPGPDNVLGAVKFEFPNPYAIYMHDTPAKELFASAARAQSSGCIRAERPLALAALLLAGHDGWTAKKIRATVAKGETVRVELDDAIPVLIVYWTVSVGAGGVGDVSYARDVYDLDGPLRAALDDDPKPARPAVAAGQ